MRSIALAVGVLLIIPLRCATADDLSLLEKYLPGNTNPQMAQSCQYDNPCTQRYTECRDNCNDTSCTYNCCLNLRNCRGSYACNILYVQCFNY
jgi:hypothetical protein